MILKRLTVIGLMALMGNGLSPLHSQNNMTLRFVSGAEQSTALTSLSKITFSGNSLVMTFTNGSFQVVDLLSVQKIGFSVLNGVDASRASEDGMLVYPNPAVDHLTLTNIPEGAETAFLYRLDGKLLVQINLTSSAQNIDIQDLPSGFYLLRVNDCTVKFVKK